MFTLEDLFRSLGGPATEAGGLPAALASVQFSGAAIDSREVRAGQLFVALQGERSDGHDYLAQALAQGARGALVRRERVAGHAPALPGRPCLLLDLEQQRAQELSALLAALSTQSALLLAVSDPLKALQRLAADQRRRHDLTLIGITGSVGKTSTKELLATVLERSFRTLKSPRSYNTESTVPLTVLEIEQHHQVAVIEMGTYGPGEIALLASIASPQIGIVTNVGASHLERMKTYETVAQAKGELVEALPEHGWAILNYDDERVRAMASRTRARVFTYGLSPEAELWADGIEGRGLAGIAFKAHYRGETIPLTLALLGRHSVQTALASAAAGLALGLSWEQIGAGLSSAVQELRLTTAMGLRGSTIIDDAYNASPVSCLAALNLLSELEGRRIAVLGDMLELGPLEEEGHRTVGRRAAEVVDLLVVVGERARWIAEEARATSSALEIVVAGDKQEAIDLLKTRLRKGDYLLVKGGRAMAMEQIVSALTSPREETTA